jgi:hypothetical protein
MFSKSRSILDRLRLRMTPEHAELLVFLLENLAIIKGLDRRLIYLGQKGNSSRRFSFYAF